MCEQVEETVASSKVSADERDRVMKSRVLALSVKHMEYELSDHEARLFLT